MLRTLILATIMLITTTLAAGEVYELSAYVLKPGKQAAFDDFMSKTHIPTVTKLGAGPVGVFVEKDAPTKVFVLTVFSTAEHADAFLKKLAEDSEWAKAANEFSKAQVSEPVVTQTLTAIDGMPKLIKPDASKPRLYNLRIYESPDAKAAAKKVEMFNTAELAIFKRVGLTPVLFGSVPAGEKSLPNLTYMLVFPDEDGRKAAWDKFRADPEWLKLKAIPEYADKLIIAKITNKILTPTAYSGL